MQSDLKAAVLRMEGTNNEEEGFYSLKRSGFVPDYVHISELTSEKKHLNDYDLIFIPGGFSSGDYVRAGALFAARLKPFLKDVEKFNDSKKLIIGVCNGFQVLSELGLLPDTDNTKERTMVLATNESDKFECRYTYIKYTSKNKIFKKYFENKIIQVPVAHLEGRVLFKNDKILEEITENDQILFKYSNYNDTDSSYPWNPNGSVMDISSLTNKNGNIIGLMPHPERVYYNYQMSPDGSMHEMGTGEYFFRSLYEYTRRLVD